MLTGGLQFTLRKQLFHRLLQRSPATFIPLFKKDPAAFVLEEGESNHGFCRRMVPV